MTKPLEPARRQFLRYSAGIAMVGTGMSLSSQAFAGSSQAYRLAFDHTHTHEKLSLIYSVAGEYQATALDRLNHFLRDHYTGTVGTMDPQLFDILHRITSALETKRSFQVISGYRCAATNDRLRTTRGGGVAKRSLHMDGRAIDIRIPGVPLTELHHAALSLKAGGVGFYPRDQFVHIDTGKVRSWGT
ncbi:DUF882 domain-containing protein [Alcaligenaceae bacterium CGII-47]|nr:DUF882 domain-containing protein [Alcaligenaceae bacterium CGII-47]